MVKRRAPKPLPVGESDFKKVRDRGCAYVDKTLLVEELDERKAHVVLMPRPRRFGKTLNLSMLRYFFEKTDADTSYLFKGLKIWQRRKYREMQGQFPVIFISLKDVKSSSWQKAVGAFGQLMAAEFRRHQYLLEGELLSKEEKEEYRRVLQKKRDQNLLEQSLLLLTEWLHRYHKKHVILLIDEYDTPAHAAYVGKYTDALLEFLRSWLSAGLKDNPHLEMGVLTGVLRIAKESVFSGLNNISTFTILSDAFSDKFGLLEKEVKDLLRQHGLAGQFRQVKKWYDGYRIGASTDIYNPWSVVNCIANRGLLASYWLNTSDNQLVKRLITEGGSELKADIEELLRRGSIEKTIEEGVVFADLEKKTDAIWALLLFSGYLTLEAMPVHGKRCRLRIPNFEVEELYQSTVLDWFKTTIRETQYRALLEALVKGDMEIFAQLFRAFVESALSLFDVTAKESEKVYHAFVLGMLVGLKDRYEVKSNRESGYGRYDVMLIPKNKRDLGIVMEFKKVDPSKTSTPQATAKKALCQIEEQDYAQELRSRGIKRHLYIAFAFKGKKVAICSKCGFCLTRNQFSS